MLGRKFCRCSWGCKSYAEFSEAFKVIMTKCDTIFSRTERKALEWRNAENHDVGELCRRTNGSGTWKFLLEQVKCQQQQMTSAPNLWTILLIVTVMMIVVILMFLMSIVSWSCSGHSGPDSCLPTTTDPKHTCVICAVQRNYRQRTAFAAAWPWRSTDPATETLPTNKATAGVVNNINSRSGAAVWNSAGIPYVGPEYSWRKGLYKL